jgi:ribosome-dependent ATPase
MQALRFQMWGFPVWQRPRLHSIWYQQVSVGVFAKALGIASLWKDIAAIALIALVFLALSLALLRKQEA